MAQVVQTAVGEGGGLERLSPPVADRVLVRRQPVRPHEQPLLLAAHTDVLRVLRDHRHQIAGQEHVALAAMLRGSDALTRTGEQTKEQA